MEPACPSVADGGDAVVDADANPRFQTGKPNDSSSKSYTNRSNWIGNEPRLLAIDASAADGGDVIDDDDVVDGGDSGADDGRTVRGRQRLRPDQRPRGGDAVVVGACNDRD